MHTLKRFTYPTFIGTCSILGTLADLLQNAFIFRGVTIVLLLIGIICLISPKALFTKTKLLQSLGADASVVDGLRPFGASCLMLAAIVFGFSTLSAKSESEGGVIASAYPEIRQIQERLGVIEVGLANISLQTNEIQKNTEKLVSSALHWVTIQGYPHTRSQSQSDGGDLHSFADVIGFTLTNDTANTFEDLTIAVSYEAYEKLHKIPNFVQGAYEHIQFPTTGTVDTFSACIVARNRDQNQWIMERRVYRMVQKQQTDEPKFEIFSAETPTVSNSEMNCV